MDGKEVAGGTAKATEKSQPIRIFFLCCVVVAGIYGAATASRKILFVQGIPGAMALILVLLSKNLLA